MTNVYKSISKQISEFEYKAGLFRSRRYVHLYFLPLFFIIGFSLFLGMVSNRNRLRKTKEKLLEELNQSFHKLSLEEYFQLKSRIIKAGM